MTKTLFTIAAFCLCGGMLLGQDNYVSKVWVADNGDGTYKNPVLDADYSDPDACRVGDDFYMTASSFNCIPGLPILHSKDLVNWTIVGHALQKQPPYDFFDTPRHGFGVWAPSIRFHDGEFFIYWGDPDFGIYMVKTKTPRGAWEEPVLVKPGKGLIDPCPLWDTDGKVYLAHGIAGSRATLKSLLVVNELTADGKKAIGDGRFVFDGHVGHETIEGPKFYKRGDYYYIFSPAGGVATGWQLALRSKNIYGPYELKIVLAQGDSPVNGPHQGAWVDTPNGENWFLHFQDKGVYGRVVHLQPMKWVDGWPVMGVDKDGDGCGEPVMVYKKPNVGRSYPIATPAESDEFDSRTLGLQWQWHANPKLIWAYHGGGETGCLRLFSAVQPEPVLGNLMDTPNMLLQKMPTEEFSAVTKITFAPKKGLVGERAGFIVMGYNYGLISLDNTAEGMTISQAECYKADSGTKEKINASEKLASQTVYLKIEVRKGGKCTFFTSYDGNTYKPFGKEFTAIEGRWIGAKIGYFCNRPVTLNDGGWIDVDYFRIEPLK